MIGSVVWLSILTQWTARDTNNSTCVMSFGGVPPGWPGGPPPGFAPPQMPYSGPPSTIPNGPPPGFAPMYVVAMSYNRCV